MERMSAKKIFFILLFAVVLVWAGEVALCSLYFVAGTTWMLVCDYTKYPVYTDGHGYVMMHWAGLLVSILAAAFFLAVVNVCISSIIKTLRGGKWRWNSWRYLLLWMWPCGIFLPLFYLIAMGLAERNITPENTRASHVLLGLLVLFLALGTFAYYRRKRVVNNSHK